MQMNVLQKTVEQITISNEESMISALRIFVEMLQNLSQLSQIIYYTNTQYPLEIYKTFRKLYENTESISNILENYQSLNQEFLQQKDELIGEQIGFMDQIINNYGGEKSQKNYQPRTNNYQTPETDTHYLQQENLRLKQSLQQNNLEFEEEIKKYNNHLYDMKETIQRYELEQQRMQELELMIEELEDKLAVGREERERDQIMIENMARKIRFFEKQKGGRQAFLSPQYGNSSRYMFSPQSSKISHINKTNLPSYRKYQ